MCKEVYVCARPSMKPSRHIFLLLLLGLAQAQPACADVYSYTDADGAMHLGNMPTDTRYTVMIAAPPEQDVSKQPAATGGQSPAGLNLASKARYNSTVAGIARTYGLESALLHAVISVESNYNQKAISRKGAVGLMQLMPETAKRYGVADSFDPVQNLHGGAKYLRDLLTMFNSDIRLAIAAYNAGENAVVRNGYHVPPIPETTHYVHRMMNYYRQYLASRSDAQS